jgi:hypothetical protein
MKIRAGREWQQPRYGITSGCWPKPTRSTGQRTSGPRHEDEKPYAKRQMTERSGMMKTNRGWTCRIAVATLAVFATAAPGLLHAQQTTTQVVRTGDRP